MDLKNAKKTLDSISSGISEKHSKLLISDLCSVIRFLVDKVESTEQAKTKNQIKKWPQDVDAPTQSITTKNPQMSFDFKGNIV